MRTLVVIAALASAAALFAQDESQIQDAIKGLGADSFEEREKATGDLKKIGAPALKALKKAAEESGDPEVRARAKRLVEEIAKPASPKRPGRTAIFQGSVLSIRKTDDATVYSLKPSDGDAIDFHRGTEGRVKLVYPDGKGGKAEAEAESIDKFVADHKALAAKYGITKDGIDYGGTKMSFSGIQAFPALPHLDLPAVPMPPMMDLDDLFGQGEGLRKAFEDLRLWRQDRWPMDRWGPEFFGREVIRGVQLAPVPDVLRSQLSIPEGQGVVVESVREGSTGAAAGLKRHDVILEIDGRKVAYPADVRSHLKRDSKVKALRGGKEQDLQPAPASKKEY